MREREGEREKEIERQRQRDKRERERRTRLVAQCRFPVVLWLFRVRFLCRCSRTDQSRVRRCGTQCGPSAPRETRAGAKLISAFWPVTVPLLALLLCAFWPRSLLVSGPPGLVQPVSRLPSAASAASCPQCCRCARHVGLPLVSFVPSACHSRSSLRRAAVVAALRALQEKLRRLESERDRATGRRLALLCSLLPDPKQPLVGVSLADVTDVPPPPPNTRSGAPPAGAREPEPAAEDGGGAPGEQPNRRRGPESAARFAPQRRGPLAAP